MQSNIKIFRLQNGEDIIGDSTIDELGNYVVGEPMTVGLEYRGKEAGLVMRHWLPVQLIKKNEINLRHKDIICVLEPNDDFVEYYLNTVEKIKELLKAKDIVDKMSNDELDLIMHGFENLDNTGYTLH